MSDHPLADLADQLEAIAAELHVSGVEPIASDLTAVGLAAAMCRELPSHIAACLLAIAKGLTVPTGWGIEMGQMGRIRLTDPEGRHAFVWPDGDEWDHTGSVPVPKTDTEPAKTGRQPDAQTAVDFAVMTLVNL